MFWVGTLDTWYCKLYRVEPSVANSQAFMAVGADDYAIPISWTSSKDWDAGTYHVLARCGPSAGNTSVVTSDPFPITMP